ncbi:hypothetical protein V2J09_007274 [Rumex salicifolius]
MSTALTNLSRWWSKGKKKGPKLQNGASVNSNSELNSWESDALNFPLMIGNQNMNSKSRRLSKKMHTRQEQKVDKEHDVVLVPSDGGCISDSDSDASDWSIGWSEPHGPDFESDDDNDGGFGVLVPCYCPKHRDVAESSKKAMAMNLNVADYYSTVKSTRINGCTLFKPADMFRRDPFQPFDMFFLIGDGHLLPYAKSGL